MDKSMKRYSRQTAIGEIGEAGQRRLLNAAVMVVGCGALGSMAAMQLAGAGVGRIGIADFDTIDISNLQRQFFFTASEAGKSKSAVLSERIQELNADVTVERHELLVTRKNAAELFGNYDFIIDATDNPASKKLVEAASLECGKSCCIGGVAGFRGQVMTVGPGSSGCFSEVFNPGDDQSMMPCAIEGVAGPAAALCASLQASEAVKHITGAGDTLAGKLLVFDLLTDRFELLHL